MTIRLEAFCTSGTSPTLSLFGPPSGPPVLVLGGLSARRDLAWWGAHVGDGAPIDTTRFRVISTDWLTRPGVATHDQARSLLSALDAAGIPRLAAAVGCSYGGMVVLALAELSPERVDRILVFGAAHRPHALSTARRWLQRRLAEQGDEGLALARALAMTTYRSDRELDARFGDAPDALQSWLEHHGRRFVERTTSERFCAISAAIDAHRVVPEDIRVPTTLVGFDTDELVPAWLVDELAERLPACRRHEIRTLYGHDAFLKEPEQVEPLLRRTLEVAA